MQRRSANTDIVEEPASLCECLFTNIVYARPAFALLYTYTQTKYTNVYYMYLYVYIYIYRCYARVWCRVRKSLIFVGEQLHTNIAKRARSCVCSLKLTRIANSKHNEGLTESERSRAPLAEREKTRERKRKERIRRQI